MALLSTNMHCSRSTSLSDKPQPQHLFAAGVKKPCINSATLAYSECSKPNITTKTTGRAPYLHIHSPGAVCPACAALEQEALEDTAQLVPSAPFDNAALAFIEIFNIETPGSNVRFLKNRTINDFRQYSRALSRFFGRWTLVEISYTRIHAYYSMRAKGGDSEIAWDRPAGANKIIQEVNFLIRVMKRAGAWTQEHENHYQPLQHIESDIPRAQTAEEQQRWLTVASSKPEWKLVYLYSLEAFVTAANHIEMRQLKLRDINLHNEYIEIRSGSSKNKYRIRTIPLDPESQAIWAMERLMERARTMGADQQHHCLFPARITNGIYDPCRPMSVHGLNRRWKEVRTAAGIPWFTPKDTRHTAITRWAESGMPIHVIMSMAGHINERMQRHYIHISEVAKRKAVRSVTRISNGWGVQIGN